MPIRRGDEWGRVGRLPDEAVVVDSDAELADVVAPALVVGERPPVVGLAGGDLCRTIGGPADLSRPGAAIVPIDIGRVVIDGDESAPRFFAAHLIVRRRSWTGPIVVVANAEFVGSADVAPRAHPGDGFFDVVTVGSMRWRDRIAAARRLPSGDHLPHPAITVRRRSSDTLHLSRGQRVWLDGRVVAVDDRVEITLVPDAVEVVV